MSASSISAVNNESAPPDKSPEVEEKKTKSFNFPSAFSILFVLTVIAAIATWFVPAGSYSKVSYDPEAGVLNLLHPNGALDTLPATQETLDKLGVSIDIQSFLSGALSKPVSVPGTFEYVTQHAASLMDIPVSMVAGTIEAADIIVFILVLGGLIGAVRATGAFEAGLFALTKKTKGREFVLIVAVSLLMALGGSFCGLEEEAVAFYPILAPIFISFGYDAITVVSAIFLAGSIGSAFSTINPFSVIIAANAAGIQFTEGIGWRILGLVIGSVALLFYIHWYSKKVKEDPTFSYSYEDHDKFANEWGMSAETSEVPAFTLQKKITLILFAFAFPLMVWGVMSKGWWFPTMAASFLIITIAIMIIACLGKNGMTEAKIVDAFTEGSSSMVGVALIIGLARGINKILNDGMISDTMLDGATRLVSGMHGPVFIVMLMLVFFLLGFVVPSSSGLAVLSMPIMAPLADTVGIPRFIAVSAFNWGQYAMLFIAPTGLIMATLQMLHVKFSHWLKYAIPVVIFQLILAAVLLIIQVVVYS